MGKYILYILCLQICKISAEINNSGSFATFGSFFQQDKREEEINLNKETAFIKPDFFSCDRGATCYHVMKRQSTEEYQINTKDPSLKDKESYNVVWKRTPKKPAFSCKDLYDRGIRRNGVYDINTPNKKVLKVYCDMKTDCGGWTVIQRRVDPSTDFNRNWSDYKLGFGSVEKNLWIGLENMHSLARPDASTTLRIELKHIHKRDQLLFAKYGSFKIGSETDGFRLNIAQYSGTAGDALSGMHNGRKFATFDRNDETRVDCPRRGFGGWWYGICHIGYLNGRYPSSLYEAYTTMSWRPIDDRYGTIYFSEMKVRRN